MAFAAAAIIMVASCCVMMDTPVEEEPEAVVPVLAYVVVIAIAEAIALTAETTYLLTGTPSNSGSGDQDRSAEATLVAQTISDGLAYYDNALKNYAQIWTLTNDHWIRQAELSTAGLWTKDSEYDPFQVLEQSGVYLNSATMMVNAAAQINEHYDSMSKRVELWDSMETYNGKMDLQFRLGNATVMSGNTWDATLGTVVRDVTNTANKVYIYGGDIYATKASTITNTDGKTVNLSEGWNDLSTISTFSSGIWTLSNAVTYAGSILPILGTGSANVQVGMVASAGSDTRVLTYNPVSTKISDGTYLYDKIALEVVPSGGTTQSKDITATLVDYAAMLDTVYTSMVKASSAASTVWSIYDKAESASAYLTTLMVPDSFENVELSSGQKEIITILAMEQLATYYDDNKGAIKTGDYTLTGASMDMFIRGSITTSAGKLYSDVIYTPIFYKDTTVSEGARQYTGTGFMAIWGAGQPLSSWDRSTSLDSCKIVAVDGTYTLAVDEILYGGKVVDSVSLETTNVDFIDPNEIDPTPVEPTPENKMVKIVMIVLIILGLLLLVGGLWTGNYIVAAIGAVVLLAGVFFNGQIADFLDWLGISKWEYT